MKESLKAKPPKRDQVVREIMKLIREGVIAPGERLATVREMSARFDVSLSVIQNALKELMGNGYVECRGASGFYVSPHASAIAEPHRQQQGTGAGPGKAYLYFCHHSDLIWRRPTSEYKKIREEQLLTEFRYADAYDGVSFQLEQAEIGRAFFEQHPELLTTAKKLAAEGRLELCSVYSIPDLNMVSGESIFRNLEQGLAWYRETLGRSSDLARFNDAFGMCAQLPQILMQCGIRYLSPGRTPNQPQEIAQADLFRWESLAGNGGVTVFRNTAEITHLGYELNVPLVQTGETRLLKNILAAKQLPGTVLLSYSTEEGTFQESIFSILAMANGLGGKQIVPGSCHRYLADASLDDLPDYRGEFNPVFTGCYTTRIGTKQAIRQAESALFRAEYLNAVLGKENEFRKEWRSLLSAQFHDAACGCHVDACTPEIDKYLETAQGAKSDPIPGKGYSLCSFSTAEGPQLVTSPVVPEGVAAQKAGDLAVYTVDLPSFGIKTFKKTGKAAAARPCEPVFDTKYFHADFFGPSPVIRNLNGKNVFSADGFGALRVQRDTGSMWSEDFWQLPIPLEFFREKVVLCEAGGVFRRVVTEGNVLPGPAASGNLGPHWPGFGALAFRKEYRFYNELDYFTLDLELDWTGCNTKVSICFPTAVDPLKAAGTYETPFSALVRKPYFEVDEKYESTLQQLQTSGDYREAKGDWPALNWVNLSDYSMGLTVANTGTPGHQLSNGVITVALLRSGTATRDGQLTPQPGSYDNGLHHYRFAFRAHSPMDMIKAYELGALLNRPVQVLTGSLPEGSQLRLPGAAVSSVRNLKKGLFLRVYETRGLPLTTTLAGALAEGKTLFETDGLGNDGKALPSPELKFKPFEIKNILIR
ncbi:MAG: GntR family transcriptional regulator [Lentisphaeria bacterium]|nr:GntR family transcriptional regulator [Lentisphaeria bacterium]